MHNKMLEKLDSVLDNMWPSINEDAGSDISREFMNLLSNIDMDTASASESQRAFAYNTVYDVMFIDWVKNRSHAEWFKDSKFKTKHAKELELCKMEDLYTIYRYGDDVIGNMEDYFVWGRFGLVDIHVQDAKDILKISLKASISFLKQVCELSPEYKDRLDSEKLIRVPGIAMWAAGPQRKNIYKVANVLNARGLPEDSVVFSGYNRGALAFDPFRLGDANRKAMGVARPSYYERWKETIGDDVNR